MKIFKAIIISSFALSFLSACAPEIGSDDWCTELKKNPKGDWTVDEVTNYAKFCLLK